jgi:hypothetical protein
MGRSLPAKWYDVADAALDLAPKAGQSKAGRHPLIPHRYLRAV